jgi:hypothetical protein
MMVPVGNWAVAVVSRPKLTRNIAKLKIAAVLKKKAFIEILELLCFLALELAKTTKFCI